LGSILVLLVVLVVSYLIVLAGAMAYELTGLDREAARFQALSAFTGAGFTTRVSELVVRHPVRRRITSTLIILGYAGTAGVVAGLLSSFHDDDLMLTVRNLAVLTMAVGAGWWLTGFIGPGLGDTLRRILTPRLTGDRVPHEELMLYKRGFGITRIEVPQGSRVCGRRLRDLDLRRWHVQVLAVEEPNDVHPIPTPDWHFDAGQHLIVYGKLDNVQKAFAPSDETVVPDTELEGEPVS
jgi:hypothetical protein